MDVTGIGCISVYNRAVTVATGGRREVFTLALVSRVSAMVIHLTVTVLLASAWYVFHHSIFTKIVRRIHLHADIMSCLFCNVFK